MLVKEVIPVGCPIPAPVSGCVWLVGWLVVIQVFRSVAGATVAMSVPFVARLVVIQGHRGVAGATVAMSIPFVVQLVVRLPSVDYSRVRARVCVVGCPPAACLVVSRLFSCLCCLCCLCSFLLSVHPSPVELPLGSQGVLHLSQIRVTEFNEITIEVWHAMNSDK